MPNANDAIAEANAKRKAAFQGNKTETGTPETTKLVPLTESAAYDDDSIEALPLFMPDMLNIKLLDPDYEPRWVNRKAGEGKRYRQALVQGFIPCVLEDVENLKESELTIDGGHIVSEDCILMKISKKKLYAAYKYNIKESFRMGGRREATERGAQEGAKEVKLSDMPNEMRGKVKFFNVSDEEAEARNTIQFDK